MHTDTQAIWVEIPHRTALQAYLTQNLILLRSWYEPEHPWSIYIQISNPSLATQVQLSLAFASSCAQRRAIKPARLSERIRRWMLILLLVVDFSWAGFF